MYGVVLQISTLSGIMVLPLKSDWGKCVIPALNCHHRTMVCFKGLVGNSNFWFQFLGPPLEVEY
jgi:hypothetical protein